jgi:hypothetical protein
MIAEQVRSGKAIGHPDFVTRVKRESGTALGGSPAG